MIQQRKKSESGKSNDVDRFKEIGALLSPHHCVRTATTTHYEKW